MKCNSCNGTLEYDPIEFDSFDAYGAKQAGKNAGAAFNGGHPGIAVAHAAYELGKLAVKKVRSLRPYKCTNCGRRSG